MLAAAAFVYGLFDLFLGLAGPFLDAANQFVFLAFGELQIVIGKLCEFLFQFALGNVPVSFGCKSAHIFLVGWLFPPRCRRRGFLLQVVCRPVKDGLLSPKSSICSRQKNSARKWRLKDFAICKPSSKRVANCIV
jgi:hypothetical protein